MNDFFKPPIDHCPYCGNKEEFYIKQQIHGTVYFNMRFDGEEGENGDMYDTTHYTGGKYAYCRNCGKRLFRLDG